MWDLVGKTVKLAGKTQHGKNRIREHGDLWVVVGLPAKVLSANPKPNFPTISSVQTGAERWFNVKDFEVFS